MKNVAGEYKIGIWVKDDTQGVGTVTYVCEDGTFAALGHGISDNETGKVLDIKDGMYTEQGFCLLYLEKMESRESFLVLLIIERTT